MTVLWFISRHTGIKGDFMFCFVVTKLYTVTEARVDDIPDLGASMIFQISIYPKHIIVNKFS